MRSHTVGMLVALCGSALSAAAAQNSGFSGQLPGRVPIQFPGQPGISLPGRVPLQTRPFQPVPASRARARGPSFATPRRAVQGFVGAAYVPFLGYDYSADNYGLGYDDGYQYGYQDGADAAQQPFVSAVFAPDVLPVDAFLPDGLAPVDVSPLNDGAAPTGTVVAYVGYGSNGITFRPLEVSAMPNGSLHADLGGGSSAIVPACKAASAPTTAGDATVGPIFVPSGPASIADSSPKASATPAAAPAHGALCWAKNGVGSSVIIWP